MKKKRETWTKALLPDPAIPKTIIVAVLSLKEPADDDDTDVSIFDILKMNTKIGKHLKI